MSAAVIPRAAYPALLDAFINGLVAYVHLYTNDPVLGPDTVKDDFLEISWEGYDEQAAGRFTPGMLRGGRAVSVSDPVLFTFAGGPLPAPARGYYVTEGRNGRLLWCWRRPGEPFAFTLDTPLLILHVRLELPPPAP